MVTALTPEFLDLADEHLAGIVREAVRAHSIEPDPAFEVILDSAAVANWRLRAHPTERRRVRVACYRLPPTAADAARETRLNQLLGAVPVDR
ncbi:hypothetical protein ACGFJT_41790 [Actinomadura geliboluensis]|uniref:hypothetical protein n=1 Tax=Actinomadura geliboluensis TaxID=882440 RepID=UPI00371BE157